MGNKETLEEAAKKYDGKYAASGVKSFIAGYKLAEQKMYSEEDMKQAFTDGSNTLIYDEINYKSEFKRKMNEWLEEYKRLEQ